MTRRRLIAAAAGIVVCLVAGYGLWVVNPPAVAGVSGDAVVSHAGGRGERLDQALALMEAEAAPLLVLMLGRTRSERAAALCGQTDPYEVLCPDPITLDTEGEARTIGRLAAAEGWSSVVVVTSDYHLRRAVLVDRRCTDVEIVGSPAVPSDSSWLRQFGVAVEEMAALPIAALTSC